MIDRQQVHKVAHLARLELTAEEEEQFYTQLSSILEYFEQLSELNTDNIPPTTRAIEMSNITRKDELQTFEDLKKMLEQAPEQDEEFFKVPRILSSDED